MQETHEGNGGLLAPRGWPDWGIWHWLERRRDLCPHKTAIVDGARRVSYGELHARVAAVAGGLRGLGIQRGDRVAILSLNRLEYVELLFAAARLGAMLVPLNWRLTSPELAFQVSDSRPRVLVVDPALADLAEALRRRPEAAAVERVVRLPDVSGTGEADLPAAVPYETLLSAGPAAPQGASGDPLLILYTSGTTGRPKGAVLAQATQFWNSVNIGTALSLVADDVTLNVLPMFHSGGLGLLTLPSLHLGATAVLLPRFDSAAVVRALVEERVTAMFAVPAIYQALLEDEGFRRLDLRRVRFSCGGAPCPLRVIEAFRERGVLFQQGYGLTETAPTLTLVPAADAFRKAGSVGKAALHAELRVVDEEGRDVPPGVVGEVWARGPNLFAGYWDRPEATREVFVDGWFRTGDLGRLDEEGFLYIVDRRKDMIISGGENIYPAEVEAVLYQHPAILDAAVIPSPHPRWGEVPLAVVVLRPGHTLTAEELFTFCTPHLARYKIPRSLVVVDELPRNAAGKVLKRVLRERFAAG